MSPDLLAISIATTVQLAAWSSWLGTLVERAASLVFKQITATVTFNLLQACRTEEVLRRDARFVTASVSRWHCFRAALIPLSLAPRAVVRECG